MTYLRTLVIRTYAIRTFLVAPMADRKAHLMVHVVEPAVNTPHLRAKGLNPELTIQRRADVQGTWTLDMVDRCVNRAERYHEAWGHPVDLSPVLLQPRKNLGARKTLKL